MTGATGVWTTSGAVWGAVAGVDTGKVTGSEGGCETAGGAGAAGAVSGNCGMSLLSFGCAGKNCATTFSNVTAAVGSTWLSADACAGLPSFENRRAAVFDDWPFSGENIGGGSGATNAALAVWLNKDIAGDAVFRCGSAG